MKSTHSSLKQKTAKDTSQETNALSCMFSTFFPLFLELSVPDKA